MTKTKCPRRHRIKNCKKLKTDIELAKLFGPVAIEKPKDISYSFQEVELIPNGDGTYNIPSQIRYVNLAQSYMTLVPSS